MISESVTEKMIRMRDFMTMAIEFRDRRLMFESKILSFAKRNCININNIICIGSSIFSQSISNRASASEQSCRNLDEMVSKIVETPLSRHEICYKYTQKLCSNGNLQEAAMLMQSLQEQNISPGKSAYDCVLRAAGEQNNIDLLCQTFKSLLVYCESMDSTSYRILARAFTTKGDDALLLRFVREVSELVFPRNTMVMNRIIHAFAECREVGKAMLIFTQMKSSKCKPDLVTYNTILAILCRTGIISDMLHVYASMEEENLVPDIISFNTLINGFRKVGRLELCVRYYQEMVEKGIELDLLTYTALIDSFSRSGNVEESLRLFDEMKNKGIGPSVQIYQLLISNVKKMGKLDLAEALLQEMRTTSSSLVDSKDFDRRKKKKR